MKIPAQFNSIKEIKQIFAGVGPVVGVGVSAFQRSGLGYILPDYEILSLLETPDLPAIRQVCPVTVVGGGERPEKLNTYSILKLNWVKTWLGDRKPLNLFVYKAATPLDALVAELGVRLLSAPGCIRKPLEDKKVFREEAGKAGIQIPAGVNLTLSELTGGYSPPKITKWDQLKQEYGEKLVFQLTDFSSGGGQGTFFVETAEDFLKFREFCRTQTVVKTVKFVNVCRRIDGRAASISGCATKYGTVTSLLQTQIMDQPELAGFKGRSGVWLGHDWNVRFSDKAQLEAEKLCQKWGDYIYRKGYKGIFGLDVVVGKDDRVTVIECNSRYTGAFPVYTMLQLSQGEMPLDVWHLAEWLGLNYEMDIKAVQVVARRPKTGSHIIMHSLADRPVKINHQVSAGIYYNNKFIRCGFSLLDIRSDDEFVLCDRVPGRGQTVKPGERIGKLIFKRRIIDDSGRLLPEIRELVKSVYAGFGL